MGDILIVDDDHGVRQIIRDVLEEIGFSVDEAADGNAGLEAVRNSHPRLIICDVRMPNLNGYEMYQRLKNEIPEQAGTPFIFLSGLSDLTFVKAGYKIGADDYLTKPVDLDVLCLKVEGLLLKHKLGDSADTSKANAVQSLENSMSSPGERRRSSTEENALVDTAPSFRERLVHAFASDRDLASGSFQFVNLEEFKESSGERWEKTKLEAFAVCEIIIRRSLGQGDSFARIGEAGYLVLFESTDKSTTAMRVRQIEDDIRKQLIGDQEDNLLDSKDQTDALNLRQTFDDNVHSAAAKLLRANVIKAEEKEAKDSSKVPNCFLTQLGQVYRPIWNAKREKIVAYQCYPTRKTSYAFFRGHACLHGGPEDEFAIHLDCFMAERLGEVLGRKRPGSSFAPLSLPVHFTSFQRENFALLRESLDFIPERFREHHLLLEITGVPDNRGETTIRRIAEIAQQYSKHVSVELSPDDRHAHLFKACGFGMLNLEIEASTDIIAGSPIAKKIQKFSRDAKALGFMPRIDNVGRMEIFRFVKEAGFGLIGGNMIGPETEKPGQLAELPMSKILVSG